MAFHSVLEIEYNGIPTVDVPVTTTETKTIKNRITDLAKQIVWSTRKYFNAVVNFLSGRAYKESDIPQETSTTTNTKQEIQKNPVDKKTLVDELRTAAKFFVGMHRQELLARKGPPGSRPGQYPRYRSTTLAKSISFKVNSSQLKVKIGYKDTFGPTGNPAFYSQKLANSGRKSIPDTIMSLEPLKTNSDFLLQWNYDSEGYV